MSYNELGKDFFECVKGKNILFMLILCCQILQSGKGTPGRFLYIERKGNWGSEETASATCYRQVLEKQFF